MKKFLVIITVLCAISLCATAQVVDQETVGKPTDVARIYNEDAGLKAKSFIVINKKDLRLYVYAKGDGEFHLLAKFPVCLSKNKGQKQRKGDMKTPSCTPEKPFTITQIQNASTWKHDFGDGRGSIKAYGHWFLRLKTGFSGIGIHGSTNNDKSVPGRASEGCIRLRDKDIITLKEKFAYVGMPVIILDENQEGLSYEKYAHEQIINQTK